MGSTAWYQRHARFKMLLYSSFIQCLQWSIDLTEGMDRVEQSFYLFAFTYPVGTDQRSSCIWANSRMDVWQTLWRRNCASKVCIAKLISALSLSRDLSSYQGYSRCMFVCSWLLTTTSPCLAYHLRREDTDWFDKPREGHPQSGNMSDRRQVRSELTTLNFMLFPYSNF